MDSLRLLTIRERWRHSKTKHSLWTVENNCCLTQRLTIALSLNMAVMRGGCEVLADQMATFIYIIHAWWALEYINVSIYLLEHSLGIHNLINLSKSRTILPQFHIGGGGWPQFGHAQCEIWENHIIEVFFFSMHSDILWFNILINCSVIKGYVDCPAFGRHWSNPHPVSPLHLKEYLNLF